MWVEFAKCDQFLIFQTDTSLCSLGLRKNLATGLKNLSAGEVKWWSCFPMWKKITFFLYNTTIACDILCYLDIPERSKHCSIFYQLACILKLWNCIFPCCYSIYDLFFSWYKSVSVLWIHGRYFILFFNMLCLEQISSQSWAYKVLIICVWRYVAIAIPLVQEKNQHIAGQGYENSRNYKAITALLTHYCIVMILFSNYSSPQLPNF